MQPTSFARNQFAQAACQLSIALLIIAFSSAPAAATPAATTVVLAFGQNVYGSAGMGAGDANVLVASPIDMTNLANKQPIQVAAGADHSLLLTDDGTVFSFGANNYGRTGRGTTVGETLIATAIDTSNFSPGQKISEISAGAWHSLILADDGVVFSFGDSSMGQTGLGSIVANTTVATSIVATNLAGRTISQIAAGNSHNLLLADDGAVFSFGNNGVGRTGLGTSGGETTIATPIDVSNLNGRKITQIAAGWEHSLLLAEDGTVFSFGWNERGQTGQGSTLGSTLVATPIDATNLGSRKITQVAAGGYHSLLLADDGTVFSFGWNQEGQAGIGSTQTFVNVATPIDTTNLSGRTITGLAAGLAHSLLLADDGAVFSFGANSFGQTGLGFLGDPTRIATPIDATHLNGLQVTTLDADGFNSFLIAVPEPSGAKFLIGAFSLLAALRSHPTRVEA